MNQKHTFIFAGRSGCGKGTQAELLKQYFMKQFPNEPVYHYYSGDSFRKYIDKGGNYSSEISKGIMKSGELQPNFLAVWLWATAFVDNLKGDEHIFIDGAPRALVEAQSLDSAMKFYGRHKPHFIVIDVSKEESHKRLIGRKREDDTEESIKKRVTWYDTKVLPAVDFYRDNPDYHFIEVNGEQSIEDVHKELISKIKLD